MEQLKIAKPLNNFKIICPHCGKEDVYSIGSIRKSAKVRLTLCTGRFGGPDWDYNDHDVENDCYWRDADPDYEHDSCYCEWCKKTFVEPDIVPISEEEKAVMEAKQLEREG